MSTGDRAVAFRRFVYWLATGGCGELPWWLRVSWKVLLWTMTAVVVYASTQAVNTAGTVIIACLAVPFFLGAIFTRLGWE